MTGMLVEGVWTDRREWADKQSGRFVRRPTTFRHRVEDRPGARFRPESGRYRLYISLACPWAHRVLITRALRGLEPHIDIASVHPFMGQRSWSFDPGPGVIPDPEGARYMSEVYLRADPTFTGVVTVPVLWDTHHRTIVNNESREIMRMLNTAFDGLATRPGLAPTPLRPAIDAALDAMYAPINNGVYRTGFASTQAAYDEAVQALFAALDHWETHLSERRFICGEVLTEADVSLFATLIRFDPVYHTHFKCNLRRIVDYPNLWGFVRDVYQTPGVRETVDLPHIKGHYFGSHESINPHRIVAAGPILDLDAPHGRAARFGASENEDQAVSGPWSKAGAIG